MIVTPESLANLGYTGGRSVAGRELIVSAIADALEDEFADDDRVRWALGKVPDFVVTPESRAELIARRARAVYDAIIKGLRSGAILGGASINGFGTFYISEPETKYDVKGSGYAIWSYETIITETRTAEADEGNWSGSLEAEYPNFIASEYGYGGHLELGSWPAGSEAEHPLELDVWRGGPAIEAMGIRHRVTVTCAGDDGITRTKNVSFLDLEIHGRTERRYDGSPGEYRIVFVPSDMATQAQKMTERRAAKGVSEEQAAALFGRGVPMGPHEYDAMIARGIEGVTPDRMRAENFWSVPAVDIVATYPRTARVVRVYGEVWDVRKVPADEYIWWNGVREAALRADGSWPIKTRNFAASMKCEFRKEFIDALNFPAEAQT